MALCRVFCYDGSNLYFKLKSLNCKGLIDFNYAGFINSLANQKSALKIKYYIGAIRTDGSKKSLEMFKQQRKLLANLKKQKAVDILRGAYKNEYDQVFLISSDSDLIPAIEEAQTSGKEVVYVGFKHQPSYALLKTCKRSILLDKIDIKEF